MWFFDYMYNFEIIISIFCYLILGIFSLIVTNDKPVNWNLAIIDIFFWPIVWIAVLGIYFYMEYIKKNE